MLLTAQTDESSAPALQSCDGAQQKCRRLPTGEGGQLMRELQANILHPHGRNHAVLLFLRFQRGGRQARVWLKEYAASHLSAAAQQSIGGEPVMVHLALSADGYRALEIDPALWPRPAERPGTPAGADVFRYGLRERAPHLGEHISHQQWDPAFRTGVHLMVMAASDDPIELIRTEGELLSASAGIFSIVAIERAFHLRQSSVETPAGQDPCPQSDFTPADAMPQLLTPDPAGGGNGSYGSYLVFRKLEHDLRASQMASEQIAQRFGLGPESIVALARRTCAPQDAPSSWQTVARRCLAYGQQSTPPDGPLPSRGQGLLFLCYQANIREQFESVQRWWSNRRLTGGAASHYAACSGFAPHVTLRGGEYLFSPSLSFFRNLAD